MNDFPVRLTLNPIDVEHRLVIAISTSTDADEEEIERLKQILFHFATACDLGLLSGSKIDPRTSTLQAFELDAESGSISCQMHVLGMEASGLRVLIGMLRGELLIDNLIKSVSVRSEAALKDKRTISIHDEKQMLLPGSYDKLNFCVIKEEHGRAKTDRLVRVKFFKRPSDELVTDLIKIQNAWVSICEGGFSPNEIPAHECSILCDEGYLISPTMFEISIDSFENPELCFNPLLNGLHKFSIEQQTLEMVHIY